MFVRGDAAAAAKAINDFARAPSSPLQGRLMNGDPLDVEQIMSIARLPSREVLYGQLVGIVASPITGMARSLNALLSGGAIALGQVHAKAEAGEITLAGGAGEAPAPAAGRSPQPRRGRGRSGDRRLTTDQDAEAPEAAESAEDPAVGPDTDTETQEDSE